MKITKSAWDIVLKLINLFQHSFIIYHPNHVRRRGEEGFLFPGVRLTSVIFSSQDITPWLPYHFLFYNVFSFIMSGRNLKLGDQSVQYLSLLDFFHPIQHRVLILYTSEKAENLLCSPVCDLKLVTLLHQPARIREVSTVPSSLLSFQHERCPWARGSLHVRAKGEGVTKITCWRSNEQEKRRPSQACGARL